MSGDDAWFDKMDALADDAYAEALQHGTAPDSTPTAREGVAEVLAAHLPTGGWPTICSCGLQGDRTHWVPAVLRTHLADALAPLIAERERRAAEVALRDAADDFARRATVYEAHPEHDTDRYLDGFSTAMRVAEKVVRDRADRIGGEQ